MAFEIDIGFTSLAGSQDINEDFCSAIPMRWRISDTRAPAQDGDKRV